MWLRGASLNYEERLQRLEKWAASLGLPSPLDPPRYKPANCSDVVNLAIVSLCTKYRFPRWAVYSLIERETEFDPNHENPNDKGKGLVQLTGIKDPITGVIRGGPNLGMPYPEDLQAADDNNPQYGYDQGFTVSGVPKYGKWISMSKVSRLDHPFDIIENLERFFTGYYVPAFPLFKRWYGLNNNDTLRALAWHWNQGVIRPYIPTSQQYLPLYDQYVAKHRPPCEAEDGIWDGKPVVL